MEKISDFLARTPPVKYGNTKTTFWLKILIFNDWLIDW